MRELGQAVVLHLLLVKRGNGNNAASDFSFLDTDQTNPDP